MTKTPVARSDEPGVREERFLDIGRALRDPDREDERLPGPALPHLPKVVDVGIALAVIGAQDERRVADHKSGVSVAVVRLDHVADLGVAGNEAWLGVPHILEEELEQRDTGHRASADDHTSRSKLRCRAA